MRCALSEFCSVSDVSRAKIEEVTLNALRTRQSLVKGERLVRHEVRAVLHDNVCPEDYLHHKILLVGVTPPTVSNTSPRIV